MIFHLQLEFYGYLQIWACHDSTHRFCDVYKLWKLWFFSWKFVIEMGPEFKIRSETCSTKALCCQNLYIIKKESLRDKQKYSQSGSVVRILFWRLWVPGSQNYFILQLHLPPLVILIKLSTICSTAKELCTYFCCVFCSHYVIFLYDAFICIFQDYITVWVNYVVVPVPM